MVKLCDHEELTFCATFVHFCRVEMTHSEFDVVILFPVFVQ